MGIATPARMLAAETQGPDIRYLAGAVDASELPSGYRNAGAVMDHIREYGLADVVDRIDPYGCIMAGEVAGLAKKADAPLMPLGRAPARREG